MANEKLQKIASRDPLTEKFNRRAQNTLISRWGGDEFAAICQKSEIESQSYLDCYYEKVDSLSEELGIEITVSAGLSRLKKDDEVQELFKRVDDILYKAKENGKAQYTVA